MNCPKCGGTNIVKIGIYYQCKALRDGSNLSCGYIGNKQDFETTLTNFNK